MASVFEDCSTSCTNLLPSDHICQSSSLPAAWVRWKFLWPPLSLCLLFFIKFHPLNGLAHTWTLPSASSPSTYGIFSKLPLSCSNGIKCRLALTRLRPVIVLPLVLIFSVQLFCPSYNPLDFQGIRPNSDVRHRLLARLCARNTSPWCIQTQRDSQFAAFTNSQKVVYHFDKRLSRSSLKLGSACIAYHIGDLKHRGTKIKYSCLIFVSVLPPRPLCASLMFPCQWISKIGKYDKSPKSFQKGQACALYVALRMTLEFPGIYPLSLCVIMWHVSSPNCQLNGFDKLVAHLAY